MVYKSYPVLSRLGIPLLILAALIICVWACGGGGGSEYSVSVNNPPVVDAISDQRIAVGETFTYQVKARDPEFETLSYLLGVYPSGMTISASGLISWTPTDKQGGVHPIAVSVKDFRGNETVETFNVTVTGGSNNSPIVEPIQDQPAKVGILFTYTVEARDPDNDHLSFSLTTSPAGMSIDGVSGVITWVPLASQGGYNDVTVAVNDGRGATVFVSFVVATPQAGNDAPVLPAIPDQTGAENTLFVYENIIATDVNNDTITYSLYVDFGSPPSWLQLSDDNYPTQGAKKIIGTPSAGTAGSYVVSLKADDGRGGIHTVSFTLTVSSATAPAVQVNSPPSISAVTPDDTTVQALGVFRASITATDTDYDMISFALTGAPDGLAVNTRVALDNQGHPLVTGLLEWRPTRSQLASHTFQIVAQDAHGGNSAAYSVTVNVVAAIIKDQTIKTGTVYNYQLPYISSSYKYQLLSAPAGAKLYNSGGIEENPIADSGRINWTSAGTGAQTITLRILNAGDSSTVQDISYKLNVVNNIAYVSGSAGNWSEVDAGFEVHNLYMKDANSDTRDDLINLYVNKTATEARVSYWSNQSTSALGARSDTPPRSGDDNLKYPWNGANTAYFETGNNRSTVERLHYENVIYNTAGNFYDTGQLEYIWVYDDNSSASGNRLTLMLHPWNQLTLPPVEVPLSYSATGTDEPGDVIVADVYNKQPDASGKDYDNGNEVVLLDRGNLKVIVVTEDLKISQVLDLAHAGAHSNYIRMVDGDLNGDGLTDICVITERFWFDGSYYRCDKRVEILLQTDTGGGNYSLVSQNSPGAPYRLDESYNPLMVSTAYKYDMANLRIQDIALGDVNGDGKDEIAVAYRLWRNWVSDVDSNNTSYDTQYSNYDYIKVYKVSDLSTVAISTPIHTYGRNQNIWVGTNTDVRVTADNGATWTTYNNAPLNNGVNVINSSHRHHYNSSNNMLDKRYIWIGTQGGGLVRMDPANPTGFTVITTSNSSIPSNTILSFAANFGVRDWDRGPIWVGTNAGLAKWQGPAVSQGWTKITTSSATPLGGPNVEAMCLGNSATDTTAQFYRITYGDYKFFGCSGGVDAVSYINAANNTISINYDDVNTTEGLGDNDINRNAMSFEMYRNMKWFGKTNGLYYQKGISYTTWKRFSTSSGNSQLSSNNIKGIAGGGMSSPDGVSLYRSRWIATDNGVTRMFDNPSQDNPTFVPYRVSNGLASNSCNCVAVDSDRNVWVGTSNGISRFTYPTASPWNNIPINNLLAGVNVRYIYVEPHQWVQIAGIKIADVTGDGNKDLVVVSNGYTYYADRDDEITRWDVQHPVSGKINMLPQVFSGGAFALDSYVPNTEGRELYLASLYSDTKGYAPHYRHGITVGNVTSNYGPDIFVAGYRDKYIAHLKYVVTP